MNRVKTGWGVAGCLLALAVSGCKTAGSGDGAAAAAPVKAEQRYKVVTDQAEFFHNSVQQPSGADEKLKRDLPVTLVKRYGGFSQIEAHGTTGYVASGDIAPRSAQEIAAEDAATLAQQAPPNALPPANGPGGAYSIPPEATRDTVLPVQDAGPTPKPTPNAMFRY